jgi:exosortase H (IPTLxxWG-CTERM-specific)
MTRFALLFLVIMTALFAAELTPPAQRFVVVPWTDELARATAAIVQFFDSGVVSQGKALLSTRNGFGVSIEAGCNGIEASIILVAAMLAFPAPWKHRLVGIAVGLVAIHALNIVRVVSLFYLGQWSVRAFEWAHLYVWQALIMLDALIVFLVWLRRLPPRPGPLARAA